MQHFPADTTCTDSMVKRANDFMALVQNLPVAIYRCDRTPECQITFVNSRIEEISGYKAKDFSKDKECSFYSIVHQDDLHVMKKTVRAQVLAGKEVDIQYRILHSNGTIRWVHQIGQPVDDGNGKTTFFIGAIFDITQNKEALETFRLNETRLSVLLELSQMTDAPLNEITSFALEEGIRLTSIKFH